MTYSLAKSVTLGKLLETNINNIVKRITYLSTSSHFLFSNIL